MFNSAIGHTRRQAKCKVMRATNVVQNPEMNLSQASL